MNYSFKSFCFSLKDGAFDPVGLYFDRNFSICNPQKYWILDGDGKEFVDLICRFESLAEDFRNITAELAIRSGLPHCNASKRFINASERLIIASKRLSVGSYYDCETKDIVKSIYRDDLERFRYTFPT